MNKDGSGQHPLTSDNTYRDELPQWSHDGRFILFARLIGADEASLWLISSTGSPPQQVASGLRLDYGSTWFGYYGYIDWTKHFDWWRGT
jgi:Tol biopolymer transport system component